MPVSPLLRLLEVVRRELGAVDARIEIGGNPPTDPRLVHALHPNGYRVVVVYEEAPSDPGAVEARLASLLEPFRSVEVATPVRGEVDLGRRLDLALGALAESVGALAALVVDDKSPLSWGDGRRANAARSRDEDEWRTLLAELARSDGFDAHSLDADSTIASEPEHREALAWLATLDGEARARELSVMSSLAAVHHAFRATTGRGLRVAKMDDLGGVFARGFAGIYVVVLAFPGRFSELHVESRVLRALPRIEALVLALPPVPPRPGKVLRLRALSLR